MTRVLVENPLNADFTTGPVCPTPGEAGTQWWNEYEGMFQELSDRSQWLKGWQGSATHVRIPLIPSVENVGPDWAQVSNYQFAEWTQTSIGTGLISFQVPSVLPAGRKITAVTATWRNTNTTNVAITTMPAISLLSLDHTSDGASPVVVGTASDPTNVLATYKAKHDFSASGLTHVINDNLDYVVTFSGESSTNATTGGVLFRVYLTLGF